MDRCDGCGEMNLRGALARTEAATTDEHGEPKEGLLCEDCWPDDWPWPHGTGSRVILGP